MKNHWLDKKIDKEIDAALAEIENSKSEFKDTDFIDLSAVMNRDGPGTRYKEYDRLDLSAILSRPDTWKEYDHLTEEDKQKVSEKFVDELNAQCGGTPEYDILTSTDKQDREMVKAILLKNFHKTHWIEEVLGDISYTPHLAPGCDPRISEYAVTLGDFTSTTGDLGNLTITCSSVTPGGDGITLNDNTKDYPGWKDGVIVDMDIWKGKCEKCGEYQWPMNDENTMMQGDPMCGCSNSCGNLDIWYPDDAFIQNETLQILDKSKPSVTVYQTTYTPVQPGTMTGTIHWDEDCKWGFTFTVDACCRCEFKKFEKDADGNYTYEDMPHSDYIYYDYISYGKLNCTTGVFELHYPNSTPAPNIIVSYEYGREC